MCRTGCPTKDHETYGQCCRAAKVQTGELQKRNGFKKWDSRLEGYYDARKNGLQPRSTRVKDVRQAETEAEHGNAFKLD